MNIIITPTDFSPASVNAAQYAADMAAFFNAGLLVVHSNQTPLDMQEFSGSPISAENPAEQLNALRKNLMKRTHNAVKITTKLVYGVLENELIKLSEYRKPFAIVTATHGATFREIFMVGSITVHLSRFLDYPVIVVPQNVQFKPVAKIIFATDLKDINEIPVEKLREIVTVFNASLHVVHVSTNTENLNSHSRAASAIAEKLFAFKPSFHFVHNKNIKDGILSFAEKINADMILTIPKKHLFFHRSESKKLIFNDALTVMSIQE